MKTHLASLVVSTAALAAFAFTSASAAASEAKPAVTHPVGAVEHSGNTLARGSGMSDVLLTLGMPDRKLTADVWAYAHFGGATEQRRDDDCSTLLLTFHHGRVSDIQLVSDRAEKTYAAQLRAPAPGDVQVAAR